MKPVLWASCFLVSDLCLRKESVVKEPDQEMAEADDTSNGRIRRANFEKVLTKLQAAAASSVALLHASLFDGSPLTRIRAASTILNIAITSVEIRDLQKRLSALERRS